MFVQLRGGSISISEVIKGFLSQRRAAAALGQRIASTAAHVPSSTPLTVSCTANGITQAVRLLT